MDLPDSAEDVVELQRDLDRLTPREGREVLDCLEAIHRLPANTEGLQQADVTFVACSQRLSAQEPVGREIPLTPLALQAGAHPILKAKAFQAGQALAGGGDVEAAQDLLSCLEQREAHLTWGPIQIKARRGLGELGVEVRRLAIEAERRGP